MSSSLGLPKPLKMPSEHRKPYSPAGKVAIGDSSSSNEEDKAVSNGDLGKFFAGRLKKAAETNVEYAIKHKNTI